MMETAANLVAWFVGNASVVLLQHGNQPTFDAFCYYIDKRKALVGLSSGLACSHCHRNTSVVFESMNNLRMPVWPTNTKWGLVKEQDDTDRLNTKTFYLAAAVYQI